MAAHPDDHEGDHADGEQGDDRLEALLLLLRQVVVEDLQADRDAEADQHRDDDARPHPAQAIATAFLHEERGDDPNDQGGFDPFTQTDDERRQHCKTSVEFGNPS